jgi:hypothetical protein
MVEVQGPQALVGAPDNQQLAVLAGMSSHEQEDA